MKKQQFYGLVAGLSSLALSGCFTTGSKSYVSQSETTPVLRESLPYKATISQEQSEPVIVPKTMSSHDELELTRPSEDLLESVLDTFTYIDPEYISSGEYTLDRTSISAEEFDKLKRKEKYDESNCLLAYVDSLYLPYVPNIRDLKDKGETAHRKVDAKTSYSSKSTGIDYGCDVDVNGSGDFDGSEFYMKTTIGSLRLQAKFRPLQNPKKPKQFVIAGFIPW